MCILCVASRWSRHIAAMVMPMVTLWALSQFLPQGFRFEINSPKLACVGVLFVSLSWCELVMPSLSGWRARRAAALKERRHVEAQEAIKRRKKATRRCRNCYTAYKDQSPASGRFMCTFCGHVSKRPVLDLPVGASSARNCSSLSESAVEFLSANGFFSVRSPKYWYDRASFVRPSWGSGRSWIGVGPWIDGANWGVSTSWFGGSWPGSALYFGNTGFGWPGPGTLLGDGVFGGERWFATDSYFGVFWFLFRIFSQLLVFAVWIWRKLSLTEDMEENEMDVEENEMDGVHEVCDTRDDVGGSSLEAKGKKARRKAEEKRLARLEKEKQEAEEKKQREEVARLVEERRRQRDRKLETEKQSVRRVVATLGKEIEVQKEPKRREEMSQGKDKVLAKENLKNQDREELTKKTSSAAMKILRPFKRTDVKDKEPSVKAASNFFSKWGAFKSRGSAKSGLVSQSRNAAAPIKPSSTDLNAPSIPCKAAVPNTSTFPSGPSSSIRMIGTCTEVSSPAWTQTAWNNVLSPGAMNVSDDTLKKTSMVGSPDKEANTRNSYASRGSINNLDVSNFMGGTSQQQFGASSSSFSGQRDQYFPDPVCLTSSNLPYAEQGLYMSGSTLRPATPITTPSEVRVNDSSAAVAVHNSMSSPSSDMFEVSPSPPLLNISSPISLNNRMGKRTCDSLYLVGPSDSLEATAFGIETNPLLPLDIASLPSPDVLESVTANTRYPCQIWEPVNDLNCQTFQEKWHCRSLTYPSQISTLPLDASFQQRDDLSQQTIVEPEFYLPSSLFSVEEIDNRECSCMPRKTNCLDSQGMESITCGWEDMDAYHRVPPEFVDCITHSLMQDPVITADGHSYERSAIEDWLKLHDTSPKTGEVLPPPPGGKGVDKTLRPNHILRCQIIEFRERVLQRLMKSAQERPAATTSDFFRPAGGSTAKPVFNSFYPTQGVESVWSHDVPGD